MEVDLCWLGPQASSVNTNVNNDLAFSFQNNSLSNLIFLDTDQLGLNFAS